MFNKNRSSLGEGMDRSIKEKEQGEKILGFCVCAQEYQKPKPLMCIYTRRNLELKFCVGWVNPLQTDRPSRNEGIRNLLDI